MRTEQIKIVVICCLMTAMVSLAGCTEQASKADKIELQIRSDKTMQIVEIVKGRIKETEPVYEAEPTEEEPPVKEEQEEEIVREKEIFLMDEEAWKARLTTEKEFPDFSEVKEMTETLRRESPEIKDAVFDYYACPVDRMDERVISFPTGHTYDAATGEKLELSDIITDDEGFWNIVKERSIADNGQYRDYRDIITKMRHNPDKWKWSMEANGIRFEYSEMEYRSSDFHVSYMDLASVMKPEYLPGNGTVMAEVECGSDIEVEEGIRFCLSTDEGFEAVVLKINDQEYDLYGEGYLSCGYVMKRPDGRTFLFLCMDYASDDYNTIVMEITGGNVRECGHYPGAYFRIDAGDFENISFAHFCVIFGCNYGIKKRILSAEGELIEEGELYEMTGSFTVKNYELPVVLEGIQTLLPINTEIELQYTNGDDIVYFIIPQTGQTGEIHYDEEPEDEDWWIPRINGMEENKYFEGLIYAG